MLADRVPPNSTIRPRSSGDYVLAGASRSKWPRPCSHQQQHEARQAGQRADREEPDPAGGVGDIAGAGRQIGAADRGERGQQRVLRRGVQRVAAQRRQIGDEDHRADGAGEVLDDDGEGQPGDVVARPRPARRTRGWRPPAGAPPIHRLAAADRRARRSRRQSRRSGSRRGRRP